MLQERTKWIKIAGRLNQSWQDNYYYINKEKQLLNKSKNQIFHKIDKTLERFMKENRGDISKFGNKKENSTRYTLKIRKIWKFFLQSIQITFKVLFYGAFFKWRYMGNNSLKRFLQRSLVVRVPGFHCHDLGSILGLGTEIPQTMQRRKKKKRRILSTGH